MLFPVSQQLWLFRSYKSEHATLQLLRLFCGLEVGAVPACAVENADLAAICDAPEVNGPVYLRDYEEVVCQLELHTKYAVVDSKFLNELRS